MFFLFIECDGEVNDKLTHPLVGVGGGSGGLRPGHGLHCSGAPAAHG